jgi:hypothetical protein
MLTKPLGLGWVCKGARIYLILMAKQLFAIKIELFIDELAKPCTVAEQITGKLLTFNYSQLPNPIHGDPVKCFSPQEPV